MPSILVTTSADVVNATDGVTSLREAVALANSNADADVITFAAGLGGSTLTLTGGELALTNDVTIDGDVDGDNRADIVISGGNASRIFNQTGAGTDVVLASLTLTNGNAAGAGGAIAAASGSLTIMDSTIQSSQSGHYGGGVSALHTTLTVSNSLVTGNTSATQGGGIAAAYGTAAISNTTLEENSSTGNFGGGLSVTGGSATLTNDTIVSNHAATTVGYGIAGGGLAIIAGAVVSAANTVFGNNTSGNSSAENDIGSGAATEAIANATNNVFDDASVAFGAGSGNQFNVDNAGLGALQNNGGAVNTHNILETSVLRNAGDNASAAGLTTDANGNDRTVAGTVDVGATEFQLVVTTAADVVNATDGVLSLREAVALANANADADVITFAANLNGKTITLGASGQLVLLQDVTIDGDVNGDNKADITISGNNANRIFNLEAGTNADILSLTLTNGFVDASQGAGIYAGSGTTLNISDTTIRNCTIFAEFPGDQAYGGGIASHGTLNVTNSTITGNSGQSGGGVFVDNTATFVNTTISGNLAQEIQSTGGFGGGIATNGATLTILNSTVTGNSASYGGGLSLVSGTTTITNSVAAANTAVTNPDIDGTGLSAQNSFFGTNVSIDTDLGGNINNGGSPGLGALQNNGGTVATHNINAGSQLINAGNSAAPGLPATDANGNDRTVNTAVDIGATEFQLTVTTAADEAFGGGSLAAEAADGGGLSLREALAIANASADADVVKFASNLAGQTLVLSGGELLLTNDVTIDGDINGDDKADIMISGGNANRIINIIGATTDIALKSLTLTAGLATDGGAISAQNIASLDILDTTISDNQAVNRGGGIFANYVGALRMANSLVTGNTAINGGGLYTRVTTATLANTTIHGNEADSFGGGIGTAYATVNLFNSTVTGNRADANGDAYGLGGGLDNFNSTITVSNSVMADNYAGVAVDNDVNGIVATATNSIFGTGVTITTNNGSTTGVANVGLGQLLDNGGTTLTRSPLDGSVLIGAGLNTAIPLDVLDVDGDGNTAEILPRDGRGGLRIVGGGVDVGAVEQIVNETIGGTAGTDTIIGGLGNDTLNGRAGGDTLDGGAGGDTVTYADAAGAVTVNLSTAGPQNTGGSGSDTLILIEHLTGSRFGDTLTGTGSANIINGGAGNDTLKGGGGNDRLDGGADTDTADYSAATGTGVTVNLNLAGAQLVSASEGSDTLIGIENVIGSALGDTLTGNGSDNSFRGGLGDDSLTGGNGSDTADWSTATGAIVFTLGATGNGTTANVAGIGVDTLSGIENLTGGSNNDTLSGNSQANILNGGLGNDRMTGGDGNDTYVLNSAGDATIETATSGTADKTLASITHALRVNIENLELTGAANINGTGNGLANAITGNAGSNILNGLAGADSMFGLGGNDTYYVDSLGDTATEAPGAGIDIVRSAVNFTLSADLDKLYLLGTAANGTGNALSNFIYGNASANVIDGGGGSDRFYGGAGNDTYKVDSTGDLVFETIAGAAGGTDTVQSSVNHTLSTNVERLTLTGAGNVNATGNTVANIIIGNTGNNFIDGKLSSDTLTGGGGGDQFLFTTTLGASNIDTITDFDVANDFVRLDDAIFAGLATGFLAGTAFVTGAAAADASDRIVYDAATGALSFDADGLGGAAAKQFANIGVGLALSAGDFFVF